MQLLAEQTSLEPLLTGVSKAGRGPFASQDTRAPTT
jgi:hypothetical protein